jgi:hypothetical protein
VVEVDIFTWLRVVTAARAATALSGAITPIEMRSSISCETLVTGVLAEATGIKKLKEKTVVIKKENKRR